MSTLRLNDTTIDILIQQCPKHNKEKKRLYLIMDYNKHKEEIDRATQLWECGDITRENLEYIFPELKESDDERIRKELISYIKQTNYDNSHTWNGINLNVFIAWLEKQSKHANFLDKIQIGDKVTRNEDGMLVNLSQLKRVAKPADVRTIGYWHVEDVEQKSADKLEPKIKVKYAGCEYNVLEVKDIAGVTYYGIEDEPNHIDYVKADNCEIISGGYGIKENGSPYPTKTAVFSEQKPAWSEEDERIYKSILYSFAHNYPLTVQQQEFVKSLRPQINVTDEELAQAKKDAYNDVLDKIEYDSENPTFDDGWSAAIWYLKKRNAQPQSHWKPSDEQMQVLHWCMPLWVEPKSKAILESLINDLKKLRGE